MKTFAVAATTGAAALLSTPVLFAQSDDLPGKMDPSLVGEGTYSLDPAHTLVVWEVDHFGFNDYFGLFGDIEGSMTLDPSDLSATELQVMIPIAQVTVASEDLKDHLLRPAEDGGSPDFFGPEPGMATFTSSQVTRTSDTTAEVLGTLEMNGRSGPVTLDVELSGAGQNPMNDTMTVGFHATTTLDRSQWGINYGQGLIGNEVELEISAAFEMQ
ncbi:MAG: YceI family protein [Erythrobacter sp.]|uniref:YceI family protein n=1 Tax=Erythrobacter sp. TaxID=1042 RepID=UPI003C729711